MVEYSGTSLVAKLLLLCLSG